VRQDDIDRILSNDETILPSSGFAAAVMEAVRREASVPPPIPFPWMRALPGLVSMGAAIALGVAALAGEFGAQPRSGPTLAELIINAANAATEAEAHWIVLALLLSLASVRLSFRISTRNL
jgi:hypothetical protein